MDHLGALRDSQHYSVKCSILLHSIALCSAHVLDDARYQVTGNGSLALINLNPDDLKITFVCFSETGDIITEHRIKNSFRCIFSQTLTQGYIIWPARKILPCFCGFFCGHLGIIKVFYVCFIILFQILFFPCSIPDIRKGVSERRFIEMLPPNLNPVTALFWF